MTLHFIAQKLKVTIIVKASIKHFLVLLKDEFVKKIPTLKNGSQPFLSWGCRLSFEHGLWAIVFKSVLHLSRVYSNSYLYTSTLSGPFR